MHYRQILLLTVVCVLCTLPACAKKQPQAQGPDSRKTAGSDGQLLAANTGQGTAGSQQTASAKSWPAFGGPNGTFIAPDMGINKDWDDDKPPILWKSKLHDDGYGGASVAEGKVFIIDHIGNKDVVRAIDLNSGSEFWRFSYQNTGKPNRGHTRATPVYSEGRLYTLGRLGSLHCLNAQDGSKLWMRHMVRDLNGKKPQWGYAWSPLVDGKKLICVPGGDGGVVALNKTNGETIWQGGNQDAPGYATPVPANFDGSRQYVIFMAKHLIGIDADNGQVVWQVPWETRYDVNAAMPIVEGPYVFITSDYGHGCALVHVSGNNASKYWESDALKSHFNAPVYYNNFLFGISNPGKLVCINPQNGNAMWQKRGFGKGGLLAVDDVLIAVNGSDGDVVMVEPTAEGYNELGRIRPLGGRSWAPPIIADGKLIVRNNEAIACLDVM